MSVSTTIQAAVATVVLDRADALNAMTTAMASDLAAALLDAGSRGDVRVVVIRGAGENFCAGGDFGEVMRLRAEGRAALYGLFTAFRSACDAISSIEVPVIAAVQGVAAAGGFELMLAADIALVSADARISDSHVVFGMIPGGGSTVRVPNAVGRQRAVGLLLSGETISGTDAVRDGLAYQAVEPEKFDASVALFAERLAGRDREAVVAIKRLVTGVTADMSFRAALDVELDAVVAHIMGPAGQRSGDRFEARRSRRVHQ